MDAVGMECRREVGVAEVDRLDSKANYIPGFQRVYNRERSQAAVEAWFLAYKGVGGVECFYAAAICFCRDIKGGEHSRCPFPFAFHNLITKSIKTPETPKLVHAYTINYVLLSNVHQWWVGPGRP